MLLEVKDLNVYYGAIHALQGISFDEKEGEIVSLIGANGAGKSTTLRALSGLIRPRSGGLSPIMCFSSVLLPQPEPPRITNTSPRRTANERSSSTGTPS